MDIKEFRELLHFDPKSLNTEEILKKYNSYWSYANNPGEPHPVLTSKKHTKDYFTVNLALQFRNPENVLAKRLSDKIKDELNIRYIDCIVSSSFAAITFGRTVANEFGSAFIFTEKKDNKQIFTERFELPSTLNLLHVEELVTTLKTTKSVEKAVLEIIPDVNFFKFNNRTVVGTIVHRPDKIKEYPDYKVVSLFEKEVPNWEPEQCPLCKIGSKAMKFKENRSIFMSYQK